MRNADSGTLSECRTQMNFIVDLNTFDRILRIKVKNEFVELIIFSL